MQLTVVEQRYTEEARFMRLPFWSGVSAYGERKVREHTRYSLFTVRGGDNMQVISF